jgi:hypothetical protein
MNAELRTAFSEAQLDRVLKSAVVHSKYICHHFEVVDASAFFFAVSFCHDLGISNSTDVSSDEY